MLMCLNPWLPLRFAPGPRSNVVFGENGAMGRVIDSDLSGHRGIIETSVSCAPGPSCVIGLRRWIGGNQFMSSRVMTTPLFKMESNDCSPRHETFQVLASWHTIFCIDVCTTTCCQWLMTQKESDPNITQPGNTAINGTLTWCNPSHHWADVPRAGVSSATKSHEREISVNT